MMTFDANTLMLLKEFKAFLIEDDSKVKVRLCLGNNTEETDGDQLESGDVILKMNGERASSIGDLRIVYKNLEADDEIKIGVQRGKKRIILTAIKVDLGETGPSNSGGGMMTMNFNNKDGEPPALIPELGLMLTDKDNHVLVRETMDMMLPEELTKLNIKGYKPTEIPGKKPATAKEAQEIIV